MTQTPSQPAVLRGPSAGRLRSFPPSILGMRAPCPNEGLPLGAGPRHHQLSIARWRERKQANKINNKHNNTPVAAEIRKGGLAFIIEIAKEFLQRLWLPDVDT